MKNQATSLLVEHISNEADKTLLVHELTTLHEAFTQAKKTSKPDSYDRKIGHLKSRLQDLKLKSKKLDQKIAATKVKIAKYVQARQKVASKPVSD